MTKTGVMGPHPHGTPLVLAPNVRITKGGTHEDKVVGIMNLMVDDVKNRWAEPQNGASSRDGESEVFKDSRWAFYWWRILWASLDTGKVPRGEIMVLASKMWSK